MIIQSAGYLFLSMAIPHHFINSFVAYASNRFDIIVQKTLNPYNRVNCFCFQGYVFKEGIIIKPWEEIKGMKKQLIIFGIIVMLITVVLLSGCEGYYPEAESDRGKIVGTWRESLGNLQLTNLTFIRNSSSPVGGDVKINGLYNGTWRIITRGYIDIEIPNPSYNFYSFGYKFSTDYNILVFENFSYLLTATGNTAWSETK